MADELTLELRVSYAKSGTDLHWPDQASRSIEIDVSSAALVHHKQTIGTTEEALALGDVTTGGWFFAINRDSTNYVEIRSGTGATDLVRLNAGEWCAFRMSSDASAPYAIANTAAVVLEYLLLSA